MALEVWLICRIDDQNCRVCVDQARYHVLFVSFGPRCVHEVVLSSPVAEMLVLDAGCDQVPPLVLHSVYYISVCCRIDALE